jgi:hypothetical protein
MVTCAAAAPLAGSVTLRGEKWQLTPAGSEAQPKPMVSVNPLLELRLMVTEVFCERAMEIDGGVRVMAKEEFVVETGSGCEVEGEWELSPAYAATMLEEPGARLGISVATPLAFSNAEPLVKTTVAAPVESRVAGCRASLQCSTARTKR